MTLGGRVPNLRLSAGLFRHRNGMRENRDIVLLGAGLIGML
jgi:hypothetical protein